ncbi:MAG: DUF350 domain-containing protein [Aigarchaeota archaeon]|nr:DUF350 domain-containing protein [Aigarchaeota archaeon]
MSWLYGLVDIGIGILQLILGVVLALFSITIALNILDRTTKGLNEFEELRKKNLAVAVYIAGVLIAVGNVIGQAVSGISKAIIPGGFNVAALVAGIIQLFVGLPLAVVIIVWAQSRVYKWLVKAAEKLPGVDIREFDIVTELKNGNIATAIVLFGTFFAISLIASQGVAYLSEPIASAILRLTG